MDCQKAMEREKMAKGMQCRREDEIQLRKMHKIQMQEKEYIASVNSEIDEMWHRVLLDDVKKKEERERLKAEHLKRGMQERRQAYDEQIASANRKAKYALKMEREEDNRITEKIKKRMEEEYFDTIKKKKEQQSKNRMNYIEGHEQKMSELRNRKLQERSIDQHTIEVALKELRMERHKKLAEIKSFQREQQLCIENMEKERKCIKNLEIECNRIVAEWRAESEREHDTKIQMFEKEKRSNKEKYASEYRKYLKEKETEIENTRKERRKIKEDVNNAALREVELKLMRAKEELREQEEYKRSLENQIQNNQRAMEIESLNMEMKQNPFTRPAIMFKDAMKDKMNKARTSTNPVHPFRRLYLQANESRSSFSLPVIFK
ncbi:trichohyalin-like [Pieris napi]|uniref:trichohyalin-like n=1 Tax=Pieris napi TaxID=78633 RepID=UPI001FBAC8E5|nr:trichohyalin-like [Pieris napi]